MPCGCGKVRVMNLEGADFSIAGIPEAERRLERLSALVAARNAEFQALEQRLAALNQKAAGGTLSAKEGKDFIAAHLNPFSAAEQGA